MTLASQAAGVGLPDKHGQKAVEAGSLSHSCPNTLLSSHIGLPEKQGQGCERCCLPLPPYRASCGTSTPAGRAGAGWPLPKSTCVLGAPPCGPTSETSCARARWAEGCAMVSRGRPRRGRVPAAWMWCSVALLAGCIGRGAQGLPFPGGTGKGGSPAEAAFVSPFKENSQWWCEALPLLRSRRDGVCPLPSWTARAQELGVRG